MTDHPHARTLAARPVEAPTPPRQAADLAAVFPGSGEMARRCRALDWAATPLGPVARWPQPLRTAVALCLDAAVPSFVWWGPDLVQVYNDAALAIVRAKHPAALGRAARDAWADVWPVVGPLLEGVLATGAPVRGDDVPMTPERGGPGAAPEPAWFTFSYGPARDARGAVAGVFCTALETTARVRAEAALRASEEAARARLVELEAARAAADLEQRRLLAVLEQLPVGVHVAEAPDGRLVLDNAAMRALCGEAPLSARAADYSADYAGHYPAGHPRAGEPLASDAWPLARALATGAPVGEELVEFRRADGTRRLAAVTATPVRDAEGRVIGAVATSLDVTERARLLAAARAAHAESEAARAEAEAANRAKGEFLAVMSHELRTPLNAIGGYAELLEMGIRGPVTPEQREDLGRIQRSQRHLLGLVNEVLNYAKLETGTVHYDLAAVGVREALAGAEALVAPQAQAKGLTLTIEACPPDVAARADAEKLRQILVNLLSNAVKFTDRGGCVDLACAAAGPQVRIAVRDPGIGIAPDQTARIFEPFVQVRAELTRPHEGTGLGLAISRDLARGMGGDLTAESVPGTGSTFTLTLPAA